jgi:hypothetical protein
MGVARHEVGRRIGDADYGAAVEQLRQTTARLQVGAVLESGIVDPLEPGLAAERTV